MSVGMDAGVNESTLASIPVVDVDSHVSEPPDLWSKRLPKRWGDQIPRVVWDPEIREHRWVIGDTRLHGVAHLAMGGWKEPYPLSPPSLEEAHPASWDAKARLDWLDENGIRAQVLYPNLLGFDSHAFLSLGEELALACLKAYNDYLAEWASADPNRLIPIMSVPFWDLKAAEAEIVRCHEAGHRGLLLAAHYEKAGYLNIAAPEWSRVLSVTQELGLSINFHVGFSRLSAEEIDKRWQKQSRAFLENMDSQEVRSYVLNNVRTSIGSFLSNTEAIADIITNGLCQRYPDLKFVSVESGFGYIPFLLQAMDWQWTNAGVSRLDSTLQLLPSEYFRRQIFATFWYERPNHDELHALQDNVMFETDFPHPTSLTPGPWSSALSPRETIGENLVGLDEVTARKVLYQNAADLYHLEL